MNLARSFAILVVTSVLGGAAGFVLGAAAEEEYELTTNVPIGQVLVFPSWESNSESARFSHTMRQADLQSQASGNTGLSGGFSDVSALTSDGSPIVGVSAIVQSADSAQSMNELIDLALAELVADDIKLANQTIGASDQRLAEVESELADIFATLDLAPNTDLGELYNSSKFGLQSSEVQLSAASEDYWLTRLPGDIAAYQQRLDSIGPVIEDWYRLTDERRTLKARVDPAREVLAELAVGQSVLDAGDHHRNVNVASVSRTAVLGRFVAGGVAAGITVGLGAIALLGIRPRSNKAKG